MAWFEALLFPLFSEDEVFGLDRVSEGSRIECGGDVESCLARGDLSACLDRVMFIDEFQGVTCLQRDRLQGFRATRGLPVDSENEDDLCQRDSDDDRII